MFIGRLDPWQKGLDLLVEAFAHAGLREAALVLVGPDCRGSRHALATLAERLGISSHVVFIGARIWSGQSEPLRRSRRVRASVAMGRPVAVGAGGSSCGQAVPDHA